MKLRHTNHATPTTLHRNSRQTKDLQALLKRLGANLYDRHLPETHNLAGLLMDNEIMEGIVYGHYSLSNGSMKGRGALVATNRRILFLDHKPLFQRTTEVTYDVVSGIARSSTGLFGLVTLSTRLGDITVNTRNQRSAATFVQAIETHIFQQRDTFGTAPTAHAY
jgi:hypothetical protein